MIIYYKDISGACQSREVNLYEGSCTFESTQNQWNGGYYTIYNQILSFTIDTALTQPLTIYWTQRYISDSDIGGHYEETQNMSVVMPAGQTGCTYTVYGCYTENYEDFGSGGMAHEFSWIQDFALQPQATIPAVCLYSPPSCDLTLTLNYTIPSVRGGSDGTITATYTSSTGTTCQYWLNGVTDGQQYGTPHVFTGLTAGAYTVRIVGQVTSCEDQVTTNIPDGEFRTNNFVVKGIGAVTGDTAIYAVENPIILQLSTAQASAFPLPSINQIYITGATISAVTINFALDFPQIYNATFQSKGYPDRATYFLESVLKNQIGQPQGTNSNEEIATSLAEVLQGDSLISRLYFITNSGSTITLESKENSPMYDLPSLVTISGSGISLVNTQGGVVAWDGQLVADYSLYVELFINPDLQFGATPVLADYMRVVELELPFNTSNIHTFDLATTLKNFVHSPKLDFTMTGFGSSPTMDTTFYCKYGEKYPLIANTNTKKKRYKGVTPVLYALNAALDFEQPNDMSRYLGYPISGGSTTYTALRFMNTCPNPKYISRQSKEYLYYLLKTNYPNTLSLRGNIYYYNGTSQTGVTFTQITTTTGATNFGGVTVLAAGYDELGLAAYENSGNTKIRKIEFAVWQTPPTGATIGLTEVRSYLFEIDEQPNKFNVAFLNKIGTYETYSFVGEVVDDAQIERQSMQIPYQVNAQGEAQNGFIYNGTSDTSFTNIHTVNTGTIDEYTYYYVMELLQSNRLYNYSSPYENYLQVIGQTVTKSSNQAEYTVQVTFKETITVNNVEK